MVQGNKTKLLCCSSSQQHCQNPSGSNVLFLSCPLGRRFIAGMFTPYSPESWEPLGVIYLSEEAGRGPQTPQDTSEPQERQKVLSMVFLWQISRPVLRVLQRESSILGPSGLCSSASAPASPWHCTNCAGRRNREIIQHCCKYCPQNEDTLFNKFGLPGWMEPQATPWCPCPRQRRLEGDDL